MQRYRSGVSGIGIWCRCKLFDKFYRAQKGDHVRPGAGLGLAICHSFVEATHGTISAVNRTYQSGAVLTIGLPIPAAGGALETAA